MPGWRAACGGCFDGAVCDFSAHHSSKTAAGKPCSKAAAAFTTVCVDIGGTAVSPAAKVVTGKVLDAADASGSNHSLSQHAAAGMSYIDTKTGEEGIDFLADFEKADSTEKPDKHIAGNGFFSHSVYLSLHIAFGDSGKSRLAEQAGENCDCKGRKQNFFEFLQG